MSFYIDGKTYYSPNKELINLIGNSESPIGKFWLNTYSEFACLVEDSISCEIKLVRDHFGCEPFFYYLTPQRLYFGSSLEDLIPALKRDNISLSINESELKYMLFVGKIVSQSTGVHEDTIYNGIKRVKPNHIITIFPDKLLQHQYWDLVSYQDQIIYYKRDTDYLEHFSDLLHEAIELQVGEETSVSAECSGGLDSSSIILASHHLNKKLTLYTHLDPNYDSNSSCLRESYFAEKLVQKYGLNHINVDASDFNLSKSFSLVTDVLAGQLQSIFPIGANIIHQQAFSDGTKILLSGFGGDECVSGHAYLSIYLPQLLKRGEYKKAWSEYYSYYATNNLPYPSVLAQAKMWLKFQLPIVFENLSIRSYDIKKKHFAQFGFKLPDYIPRALSVAEFESRQLIGVDNHHVSYRIEDSALIARKYGFKYKYPLLYPKLVEFCNRLPLHLKRKNGLSRILLRSYLAKAGMPEFTSKPIAKFDGNIMGASLAKIRQSYRDDFKQQLESPLRYMDILQKIIELDPNVNNTLQLYHELAILSLNQYLSQLSSYG